MPLWLIISLVGLGTYFLGQQVASAQAAANPQLPQAKTITVGSNGADWYDDLGTSSSLAADMATDMVSALSSSSAAVNVSTTVGGQIPAGTVLTPIDVAEISVSSGGTSYQQGGQQSGTMTLIPVVKVYWNSQFVWVNKNEVF